jgi:phage recombination protein Bet
MSLVLKNSQHSPSTEIIPVWTEERIRLLKKTFFSDSEECLDAECELFLYVCQRTRLDPFLKQIHPVKRRQKQKNGKYETKMTIQTGIDGFRAIAERTSMYCPGKEPSFTYDSAGNLYSATAYIKKLTKDGTWHEISATAFWKEYVQTHKDYNTGSTVVSSFWQQMPHGQLAKCAEALALRKAFPFEYTSLYSFEEMAQASNPIQIEEIPFVEQEKAISEKIEEQPDMTPEEVSEYIEGTFPEQKEMFTEWMEELRQEKKWNYRKTIENFSKHAAHTKKVFSEYQCKKLL